MKTLKTSQVVACELCGEPTIKVGWKQRRCKICVPTQAAYRRARRYNISQPTFEAMLQRQQGKCVLCPAVLHTEHINGMHVDHDHVSGKVRGLLYGNCNVAVGRIEHLLKHNNLNDVMTYLKRDQ